MGERPTEDTYVAELISVIKQVGGPLGFDAEFNWRSPSGKPDIKLYYRGEPVAIVEVKRPEVMLSDPKLNEQALRYAKWYRKKIGIKFYGIHNMKYLFLFKFVGEKERPKTILDFIEEKPQWVPVSDFPFQIMPWVKSIEEYKQISTNKQARKNLEKFLLRFKEILEGKLLDLSGEVITTIGSYIERGASLALDAMENLYKKEAYIKEIFEEWRKERGYRKPRNNSEFRDLLGLMLKEQLYTFSMKVLFFLVLQSIDADMASKLKENLAAIEPSDPVLFKKIFDMLFKYAIERTGDFEEVFGSNTVDRLPILEPSLPYLKQLISYLNQIRWSEINVDVIGRIFEGLIYSERRHLLGQHFTDTKIVDLILTATLKDEARLLDPACGSGTFLVRALNLWRVKFGEKETMYDLVEGIDIDKLAAMLSKINLYIQALERIKSGKSYLPSIRRGDFFKLSLTQSYRYVVANPPYTRQEEMAMAFYDRNYKQNLLNTVEDIKDWSKRASIYAYFLVKGGKLLEDGGRLGFIVENSWLNAEYGGPLKKWLLENFTVEYIVESLVERWFEDAAIITNIIIAQKKSQPDYVTRFLFLKKKLRDLIGAPPPASDFIANQRYYERIGELYAKASKIVPSDDFAIWDDDNVRVVVVKKKLLEKIEEKLGRWGVLKGPEKYLRMIVDFVEEIDERFKLFGEVFHIWYGLKTNANEIFYLPSKYWAYYSEDDNYLCLVYKGPWAKELRKPLLKISKSYLRPLIRPSHIESSAYELNKIEKKKKEDYVLWVVDVNEVSDENTRAYIEWAKDFILKENKSTGRFPSIIKYIDSPSWTKLSDTSGGLLILKNAVHKNYAILLNRIHYAQIDLRLYAARPTEDYKNVDPRILFATANSIITYLGMELIGRTNLGEGALDIKIADYEKIPIVDPAWIEQKLKEEGKLEKLLKLVDSLISEKPLNIEEEINRGIRLRMEELLLGSLGLSRKDILSLYKGLIKLVEYRTQRASNILRDC